MSSATDFIPLARAAAIVHERLFPEHPTKDAKTLDVIALALSTLMPLYQRDMDLIYAVCLKYLKEPAEAQDAVMGNAHQPQGSGKCNRKQTAWAVGSGQWAVGSEDEFSFTAHCPLPTAHCLGKGETVRGFGP